MNRITNAFNKFANSMYFLAAVLRSFASTLREHHK